MQEIGWDDFMQVELRVGRITAAEPFPQARKPVYKLQVDFGPELGVRKSSDARQRTIRGAGNPRSRHMGKTAAQLVQDAKSGIENLSVDQVEAELASGDCVLVDVRDAPECAGGRIPGAVHASRGMLEFYADPSSPYHKAELDPSRRVILHCASGGRSALAVKCLQTLGYGNVAHLDGGFKAWEAAGKPVEK